MEQLRELRNKSLEELPELFDKETNPIELNKIMTVICENWVFSDSEEQEQESNYLSIEEDLYEQTGLFKLEDLDTIPLEEIQESVDSRAGNMIVTNNNKIGESLDHDDIHEINYVNNIVPQQMYRGELSCTRPRYISGRNSRFDIKIMPNEIPKAKTRRN